MKKFFVIFFVVMLLLSAVGQIAKFAMYVHDKVQAKQDVVFTEGDKILPSLTFVQTERPQVGLPKVEVPTQDRVVLMQEIAMERENALCQSYSELPLLVTEEYGPRLREDYPVDISVIRSWLENPLLYVQGSTKGERKEVTAAKYHYRTLVKEGKIKNPFSNEQLISIMLTEAMWLKAQKGQNIVNLNTVGDRGYSDHEEWAHGPFQISKRMHESIEIFKEFNLKSTDFLGDLELSIYAYVAWHEQWTDGETFEKRMAMYNAGPTGAQPGHKYHSKGKRYAQKVNSFLEIVSVDTVGTLEEVQFSRSGSEKFELPSWDEADDSKNAIASNP